MGAYISAIENSDSKCLFDNKISNRYTTVVASEVVNGAYYAACQVKYGSFTAIYAVIIACESWPSLDRITISDEFEGLGLYECPESILIKLSGPEALREIGISNKAMLANSRSWRSKCELNAERASLNHLTATAIQRGTLQIREGF